MDILVTNDDGLHAAGLQSLRAAVARIGGARVVVVAPDSNRSGLARSITLRQPLWVEEVTLDDGTVAYATDGTPVDCVRLAALGLVEGFRPELVVSGINHGSNLGDDITYSGTVAAALEGLMLGLPAIAVSQDLGVTRAVAEGVDRETFDVAARFVAGLVEHLPPEHLPPDTLLNINFPAERPSGVSVTRLGKRIYGDELELIEQRDARRRFRLYGEPAGHEDVEGSDLNAVAAGHVAVTPVHFDLTSIDRLSSLQSVDLSELLA